MINLVKTWNILEKYFNKPSAYELIKKSTLKENATQTGYVNLADGVETDAEEELFKPGSDCNSYGHISYQAVPFCFFRIDQIQQGVFLSNLCLDAVMGSDVCLEGGVFGA
ncbi:hypothetical protein [Candidatus Bathycorpusculum sp.]|jgi:hypothetical protein|uniref:hypothetical protein n=1 Tax=Candidatus Bathycorpusculum sp. TaxID=2994959 RepID=UPI002816C3A8|nr:hypothetical protein [Candidatus Termitimicrobium sp.]MCL2685669.1 hypothetical protein [Candidatus Termitimicrobium sp.]